MFGPCYAVPSCYSSFAIILLRKRGLVALFSLSARCLMTKCSVALPHSVTGWSAVCDCGISWSFSLFLFADFLSCGDKYCKFGIFREGFIYIFRAGL